MRDARDALFLERIGLVIRSSRPTFVKLLATVRLVVLPFACPGENMKSKRAILIELLVAYLGITVSTSRAQIAQVSAVSLADPGSSARV